MLMKLKALRPNKTPALKTGCLSDNQNTPATWSKMLIKVVHFLGGGGRSNFNSTVCDLGNETERKGT